MKRVKDTRESESATGEDARDRLRRQLTLTDTTFLVVSSVIGAGIFITPGAVASSIPEPSLFLFAWVLGGALSLAGALANAELGGLFPRAGGDYVYLREAFHPVAGFLVGWLTFFVIYAGTVATLATASGDILARLFDAPGNSSTAIAIATVVVTTWVNYSGLRAGASFNNLTAILKVAAIALLVLLGFAAAGPEGGSPGATTAPRPASTLEGFALAMSPVLFTYLGWNAPIYVASEIRDPARNLPRSLFLGLGICTGLYLLLNLVYLRVTTPGELASSTPAGELVARALFGEFGGELASILILLSIHGCLNATILVGPRIAYAMALDGLFFRGGDRVHETRGTPHIALIVQAMVAIGLIAVLRTFPSVLDYTTFAIVLATMADVASLYALRRKRPDAPRPYRAWGYPFLPAAYFVANAAIALAMILGRPLECLIALGVTATGLPFLWLFSRRPQPAP